MEDKYFYGIIAIKERSPDMPMQKLELTWCGKYEGFTYSPDSKEEESHD